MLATFPAVAGIPTIVMGQPEATRQSSPRWVLTLLHEHVHQLQSSQPDYYAGVAALNLARGDTTGQWMLDYPFPYDAPAVVSAFSSFTRSLGHLLSATSDADATTGARELLRARRALRESITAADDRYLEFQLWQEGVARYAELRLAAQAASLSAGPDAAFQALPDYAPYHEVAAAMRHEVLLALTTQRLDRTRRVTFYAAGAALALALDRLEPAWRTRYFTEPFRLGVQQDASSR
jgi:hypothetical protein